MIMGYAQLLGLIFLCQAIVPSFSNIISNGDFESESGLDPWYCNQAHCDVITDASQHFLALTQRKAVWSGPRQLLDPDLFNSIEDLKTTFNFSMYSESSDSIHAEWKIKVEKGQETQYFSLFGSIVENHDDWTISFDFITLPQFIIGSDKIELYLEVSPENADYILDNVILEIVDEGNWVEEANQRIDTLRKSNINFHFNFDSSVKTEDLLLEIEQKTHKFPFGTAVVSTKIAECFDAKYDDHYCVFVRDNFNWMVDSYRMKWRPSEPSEGEIHTEIPDKMITWAHNNGKTVRGHALLWAKRSNNPDWVQNLYGEDLKTAVFNRLDFAVNHYEQYNVPHWDVINEMVNEGAENHTFFLDHTGDPNIRAEIFKYVKELSPDTLFFVNDYGIILNNYGRFPLYQQQIRELLAAGAPIDAIGLQSHLHGQERVDINAIKYHVDLLWEEFKLPIWVTEFDWNADKSVDFGDHSYHAEQLENFYRLMFSHEAVNGILMWSLNILNESTDLPNKAGNRYSELYHSVWRSNANLRVNPDGQHYRGFKGDYNMKISRNPEGILSEINFTLEDDLEIYCDGDNNAIVCY